MNEAPLRAYLKRRFHRYHDTLPIDADLSGVMDSLGLFELVEFVEAEFGVKVPTAEFRPARFASIREILTLIDELKNQNTKARG